ncbi:MAG: ABC transporter ATP-binding protein [Spirochaetales bacterium]|nr:ABC transporter ATP-binding protein [Spirochaetales bacterium]
MIKAENLTKSYGRHLAVDNISFSIEKGEVIGFLGPNGAGKSTTMNMMCGCLAPSEGRITINGIDIMDEPEETRKYVGYLPEQPPLYFEMTVTEYLKFVGELKRVPKKQIKEDIDRIVNLVKIADVKDRLIRNLSKGYKQRVGIAQALMGNPPILVLDEPSVGLDPKQIIEIRNLINELKKDHTLIISSHILPEISAVCDRVLIINKGNIVASDTPENLSKRLTGSNKVYLRIKGEESAVRDALSSVAGAEHISVSPCQEEEALDVTVEAEGDEDIREKVFFALSGGKLPLLQMRPMEMSLEDIFLNLTTVEENA